MSHRFTFQEHLLRWSKKHKKQLTFHTSVLAAVTGTILIASNFFAFTSPPEVTENEDSILTATIVGDMMFGRYVEEVIDRKGYDYLFEYTDPYFAVSDFATGNFKHPLLIEDRPPNPDQAFVFSTTTDTVDALKQRNFRSLSIANNNIYDHGQLAFRDTVNYFNDQEDIAVTGHMTDHEDLENAAVYDHNGLTIATLGVTDVLAKNSAVTSYRPGVIPLEPPHYIINSIVNASKISDLVIVHVHWGEAYDSHISSRQRDLAKAMSHAGADIIIGHYPHVLAPIEVYNDTVIFYSLGNFIFDQGWSRTKQTALAQYNLLEDGTAEIELVPYVTREGQPRPVGDRSPRASVIQKMLTKNLDPETYERNGAKIILKVNHERVIQANNEPPETVKKGGGSDVAS